LDAIADEIQKRLKKEGVLPLHTEGSPSSGWILLDYLDVIVHLFAPSQREFYRLEALWEDAKILLRVA
jgi:ribosome-associated protein